MPIYIDTRLLNAGLSSFSAETGFVRQNYGLTSFDYDYGHPALSATGRYGYSSNITVEGHTELTRGLANAGAGVLVKLGNAGVINGAVSASGGELSGLQLKLGYQLITPRFSVTVQTQRATPRFGDLAAVTGSPILLETDQIALSLPLFGHQTVSVSLVQQHQSGQAITRLGSLSYNAEITRNIGFFLLSLYRDFAGSGESGGYASLNFALPNQITASASLSTANGQKSWGLNAARPADYSGGLGWALQDNNNSGSPYQQARANYLGRYGEVLGAVENSNGTHNYSLDINGALVWMDSDVIAARRISDAFALVSTDGMEGVQVLHEYRPLGVTNSNGHLLVPDLIAWQNNHVGINGVNLPADARLTTTESDIVPQAGSGAMAYFR